MSSSQFTPNTAAFGEGSNPKDWAYQLGMLPQNGSIVFTKANLISFLKTHGVEVSTSYSELRSLPKYASIGKLTESSADVHAAAAAPVKSTVASHSSAAGFQPLTEAQVDSLSAPRAAPAPPSAASSAPSSEPVRTPSGDVFRPTRRVREPIGGGSAQIGALFGGGEDDEEAIEEAARESARRRGLASAAQEESATKEAEKDASKKYVSQQQKLEDEQREKAQASSFRPTRRVREPVGGGSDQINALFG